MQKSFDLYFISKYRPQLMGVATLMIICCHCPHWCTGLPGVCKSILIMGYLGVDMFLLLSGIGMYYSWKKQTENLTNTQNGWNWKLLILWYSKRYKRFLVPYLMIAIPCYSIIALQEHDSFTNFILNVSTISYWLYHKGAWYIAMLFPLYLLTPLIIRLMSGKYRGGYFVILTIICLFSTQLYSSDEGIINNIIFVVRRLPSFFLGIIIAPYAVEHKKFQFSYIVAILVLCTTISAAMYLKNLPFEMFAIVPIIFFSIVLLHLHSMVMKYCNQALASVGKISLESYIFNILLPIILSKIQWDLIYPGINHGNYLMYSFTIIFGLGLSYVISNFSHIVIEMSSPHKYDICKN